jgi:hypothetical protein
VAAVRYEQREEGLACLDCGSFIADQSAHTRFHSILSGHAWALAIHVRERIGRKKFDNWSADALAEVARGMPE